MIGNPSEPPPFPSQPLADSSTTQACDGNQPFTIVIDTREQTPLAFPGNVSTIRAGLHTGDYSIAGREDQFTVERKSLADLIHTIIHDRARFERELERMRTFEFRRVICTASMDAVRRGKYDHSRANPKAVVASIATFEVRYNVPFVFTGSSDEAARRIVDWARYYNRELALREHGRMLAGRSGDGTTPPALGSFQTPASLPPTREGAALEVIPPIVYEGGKKCKGKKRGGVKGCLRVSPVQRTNEH